MSAIINGSSPSVTFSDGTTQATSAIVSGYVPYANLPAGSVLQVVQGSGGGASTSSTTPTASTITVTITPKFASSKILILVDTQATNTSQNGASSYVYLYKNGSTQLTSSGYQNAGSSSSYQWVGIPINYLDSPATTSATTYTVYVAAAITGTAYVGYGSVNSHITAMEIAA